MTQTLWFLGARFNIIADATTTGGKYDLLEAYFPPGRQTAPHLHTRYSEQIYVLEGEFAVWAGSAGCFVANRLTEDCNVTVLLLEAGNPDTKPEIQIPGECLKLIGSEVDWGYFSEPEPYLNGRKMFCSRGKVLGGSSSINAMVYVRGNPPGL